MQIFEHQFKGLLKENLDASFRAMTMACTSDLFD
jgi:hypothetical protein